jgi:phosphoglycerate dehydrogenase-like enzyme
MPTAAFFSDQPHLLDTVYGGDYAGTPRSRLHAMLDFYPAVVSAASFDAAAPHLRDLQVIFSTWGMPCLTAAQIQRLPALKAVFYAAGTVQYFARPFLECGVQVVSAWAANAVPVVEFSVAQIFLALKGYFPALRQCRTPQGRASFVNHYPGAYGSRVAVLGAGMIGAQVLEALRPHDVECLVFDPFLSEARAAALGARKVSLEEAFSEAFVISNHLADLPETRGMLRRDLFERMQPYAAFINTGRGATVDEAGMLDVFSRRPDLTALIDVTYPEPPAPDSPFYRLENVLLSPHMAGSIGAEVSRQADWTIEEYTRFAAGQPLRYAVTLEMLKTMA